MVLDLDSHPSYPSFQAEYLGLSHFSPHIPPSFSHDALSPPLSCNSQPGSRDLMICAWSTHRLPSQCHELSSLLLFPLKITGSDEKRFSIYNWVKIISLSGLDLIWPPTGNQCSVLSLHPFRNVNENTVNLDGGKMRSPPFFQPLHFF